MKRTALPRARRSDRPPARPPDRPAEGGSSAHLDLLAVARLIWSELPTLALLDLLFTVAAALVAAVALVAVPLAPLAAAVQLGPLYLAGTRIGARALSGESVGPQALFRELPGNWRTGAGIALLPAGVLAVLIGSVILLGSGQAGSGWVLVPVLVDAVVLLVVAAGCVVVFPLAAMTSLGYRERWLVAVALAGRHLVSCLGLIAIVILLAVSVRLVGPVLLFVAIGPFCLLNAAAVRGPMLRLGAVDELESPRPDRTNAS